MKTELRLVPHTIITDQKVIEIWHNGQLIGTVAGADGPGVRIISKYSMSAASLLGTILGNVNVMEVKIIPTKEQNNGNARLS